MSDEKNSKTLGLFTCNKLATNIAKKLIEKSKQPGFNIEGAIENEKIKLLNLGYSNKTVEYICKKIKMRFQTKGITTQIECMKFEKTNGEER